MKRGPNIFNAMLRIYGLHLSAILAIWLGTYYPGLDIALSILYLLLLWTEGQHSWRILRSPWKQALIAVFWQLPGFLLAGSILSGLDRLTEFAYYFVFILELWHTPVLPLISLLPVGTILDIPIYYGLSYIMVPVLSFYYYMPAMMPTAERE